MSVPHRWTFRLLAAALVAVAASTASAQVVVQPKGNPSPGGAAQPKADPPKKTDSKTDSPKNPFAPQPLTPANGTKPSVYTLPSINSWPGIPVYPNTPAVYTPPFWNPALNNPWMNPVTVVPVYTNPFNNPFVVNPVNPAANPLVNPFNNPFLNPFAINPLFDNPLVLNQLLHNRFNNRLGPNVITGCWGSDSPGASAAASLYPSASYTPPTAVQSPGLMLNKGPDLQPNGWAGTEYYPVSGTVVLADGSTFYRVSGGQPTGPGPYYNPQGGTFFSPSVGALDKPGTAVFLPYVW